MLTSAVVCIGSVAERLSRLGRAEDVDERPSVLSRSCEMEIRGEGFVGLDGGELTVGKGWSLSGDVSVERLSEFSEGNGWGQRLTAERLAELFLS